MRRHLTLLWTITLVLTLVVTTMPAHAQQVPAYKCNRYSLDPASPFCLLVPVENRVGAPLRGASVTVFFNGRSIQAYAGQTIDGNLTEAVAALPVEQLGVRPGDHLDLRVSAGGVDLRRIVGFMPDPQTRTFTMAPVQLAMSTGLAPIYGRVYAIDTQAATPLSSYTLELYQNLSGSPISHFESVDQLDFKLTPPRNVRNGATLYIVATRGDQRALVSFIWRRQPVRIDIALNWPCGGIAPNTGSGGQLPNTGSGGQIPDPFCLVGSATLNGEPQVGVSVSAQLLNPPQNLADSVDLSPIITSTRIINQIQLPQPIFVMDVGRLTSLPLPNDAKLRLIAQRGTLIGSIDLSVADLKQKPWGARGVEIALRHEHMQGAGMAGGKPALVAVSGSGDDRIVYAVARDGLLVRQFAGDTGWMAILGNSATMLGQPEVTALAVARLASGSDLLVAGTIGGDIYRSTDSGQTWDLLGNPLGRVRALALDDVSTLSVLGSGGLVQISEFDQIASLPANLPTLSEPPPGSLALAVDSGVLFAGGPGGLFRLAASVTGWLPVRPEAVNTLASVGAGTIFAGTDQGIFATDSTGSEWADQWLNAGSFSLAASGGELWAVTASGLLMQPVGGAGWHQVAITDSAQEDASLGTPSVYELSTSATLSYAAAQTGVSVSDDGGQNWHLLNPSFTMDTRSVTSLASGSVLALGPEGLFEVTSNSVTQRSLPITTGLNPAAIRVSNDGAVVLVGRSAGAGYHLLIHEGAWDGGTWSSLPVGAGRGISDIAFFPGDRGNTEALIATMGDGLFLWTRGAGLVSLPALPSPGGRRLSIGAITITDGPCTIVAGTDSVGASTPAAIYTRPCDTLSPWIGPQNLARSRSSGQVARLVTALAQAGGRIFASSDAGFFQGQVSGSWEAVFGQPIRPLALAPSGDYAEDHTILAGGQQSGVIRLFDSSPDLYVDANCLESARGDTKLTCTIRVGNEGLIAVQPGSMLVSWSSPLSLVSIDDVPAAATASGVPLSHGELVGGASKSYTLQFAVSYNARPGSVRIDVRTPAAAGEIFLVNNKDHAAITIDYRNAPDPAIVIGGQRMIPAGSPATLHIHMTNLGTEAMTSTATLSLVIPAGVTLETPDGVTHSGPTTFQLPVEPLPQEDVIIPLLYQILAGADPNAPMVLEASLIGVGDDREVANNSDTTQLLLTPDEPLVVVLTNMPRLARRGPVDSARSYLSTYLTMAAGFEIPLDAAPPCADDPGGISCAYEQWDSDVASLATAAATGQSDQRIADLATQAVQSRSTLQAEIEAYIRPMIAGLSTNPPYLYIVGDDEVIPFGAVTDLEDNDPLSYPESYYATDLPWDDTLYSLFKANSYPSDRTYDTIGQRNPLSMIASRQPGGPTEIAAALQLYQNQGGSITISAGVVAGFAKDLTESVQRQVCDLIRISNIPLAEVKGAVGCGTIAESVAVGLPPLTAGGRVAQLSNHASRVKIGDASTEDIRKLVLDTGALNLVLLLGCHSGVSAGYASEPTLVTELARLGQPSFGFLGYAYAGTVQDTDLVAYAGRMQLDLMGRLLGADRVTLGEALRQALADYGQNTSTSHSDYHEKTLASIALFGPPTYEIAPPASANLPALNLASLTQSVGGSSQLNPGTTPQVGATLSVTMSYETVTTADGTFYRVLPSAGSAITLTDAGLPLQPGVDIAQGTAIGGVMLTGGTFTTVQGVDPVIMTGAPISADWRYAERAYVGGSVDRPDWIGKYTAGDGLSHLVLVTGQWRPANSTQRLIESLSLRILPRRVGRRPAKLTGHVRACRQDEQMIITAPAGEHISQIDIVLINDGTFNVIPMRRHDGRWVASFEARPGLSYYLQAAGNDGQVVLDTNHERMYHIPGMRDSCDHVSDGHDDWNRCKQSSIGEGLRHQ